MTGTAYRTPDGIAHTERCADVGRMARARGVTLVELDRDDAIRMIAAGEYRGCKRCAVRAALATPAVPAAMPAGPAVAAAATTTANGLAATAVRGAQDTWIVRMSKFSYWAIRTDGADVSSIDTDQVGAGARRWEFVGAVHHTHPGGYEIAADGRTAAGWFCEYRGVASEPSSHVSDALGALETLIRESA